MTRVATVQLAPRVGALSGNLDQVAEALRTVVQQGADIVVLPELATSGYVFESMEEARQLAIPASDPVFTSWAELVGARPGAVAVVGFAEADGSDVYNSAAVITGDGVLGVYRKVHLWDREKLWFQPGAQLPLTVDTAHGRLAVMICFDLEFPEWTRIAALAGADLVAVPTNWPLMPRPEGERVAEVQIAMAAARVNHVAIAFADRTGVERNVQWSQASGIVGADGWLRAEAGPGVATAWAELDLTESSEKRLTPLADLLSDRRPDLYDCLIADAARPSPDHGRQCTAG